jgi:hypothetical protein
VAAFGVNLGRFTSFSGLGSAPLLRVAAFLVATVLELVLLGPTIALFAVNVATPDEDLSTSRYQWLALITAGCILLAAAVSSPVLSQAVTAADSRVSQARIFFMNVFLALPSVALVRTMIKLPLSRRRASNTPYFPLVTYLSDGAHT